MKNLFTIIIFLFGCIGCNQKEKDINKKNREHLYKKEIDRTIENIFDFSSDTIFACKYGKGLIFSTNKGKSWTQIADSILFDEITITNKGYLVGLDSWRGIHEADYARLFISKDFGKTWQTIPLNTKRFFPISIISLPHQRLQLQTVDNKIYELNGEDLSKDWKFIKTTSETESLYGIIEQPIQVDDYDDHKIKLFISNGNKTDTLAKLGLCRQVNNVIITKDFTYISGSGYVNLSDKTNYAYFATLNKKNKLKEYKISGSYAYLKKTQLKNVYVFNDAGIYISQNDSLKKIY
jgi:hypothetical protein